MFRDVKVSCHLGSSDHEKMEFKILSVWSRANNRITNLTFRRADWSVQGSVWKKSMGSSLERRGLEKS